MRSSREEKFELVYRECLRDVKTYAWSHVGRSDGDDVVNATFMAVWQRLDEIPWPSRRAWVLGVCRNHCRNRWRTNRRFAALVGEIEAARPQVETRLTSAGFDVDARALVGAALESLSVKDRELFVLALWLEMSPSEIAAMYGVPDGAVRVRVHRLRERLARHLGDELREGIA